jgi:hypothetical protein
MVMTADLDHFEEISEIIPIGFRTRDRGEASLPVHTNKRPAPCHRQDHGRRSD